ncbi:MAG: hypothetical protein JST81_10260 [Bacteroidetes bacterium]|nr:hypothetical protein [Bacteroidota bacterium]
MKSLLLVAIFGLMAFAGFANGKIHLVTVKETAKTNPAPAKKQKGNKQAHQLCSWCGHCTTVYWDGDLPPLTANDIWLINYVNCGGQGPQ